MEAESNRWTGDFKRRRGIDGSIRQTLLLERGSRTQLFSFSIPQFAIEIITAHRLIIGGWSLQFQFKIWRQSATSARFFGGSTLLLQYPLAVGKRSNYSNFFKKCGLIK